MKIKIFFTCFVLILSIHVAAQYNLSGTIIDAETKDKLPQVLISIVDLKSSVLSNQDGFFAFSQLKKADYLMSFSKLGYETLILNIHLDQDTNLSIQLNFVATEMNEVVVTGSSMASDLKDNPIIITTVSADELKNTVSSNAVDALKNVPGVSQITSGPAVSKPIIRGLGYNRVLTLYNGIRQEGQQWGDEHGIEIDRFSIDRVEIIKGPGSLMYGSDGIAGVINFLPPKALPEGKINTQVATNYQSNNNLTAYSVVNSGNKKGFQWRGRLSNTFAGNFSNVYDGKVVNSGFRELDGQLFLGLNKKWGHSHLTVSSYNNLLNLAEGDRDSLGRFILFDENGEKRLPNKKEMGGFVVGIPHQQVNHIKLISNNFILLKKGSLKTDFAFQNNKRREYGNPANPQETELYFDLYTFNLNTGYNLPILKSWKTAVGIGSMYQINLNKGEEVLIPQYQLFDVGAYISTQKKFFEKLTFAAGLRFDSRFLQSQQYYDEVDSIQKFKAFKRNFFGLSGSIGLSFRITKSVTMKLNLSRGFRIPNLAELASNGRHEGTFRYEIGNNQLKPEFSNQLDWALYMESKHVSFSFSPFVNWVENYVFAQKITATNGGDSLVESDEENVYTYQYRQNAALLYGGEVYLDFHPHPLDWLHVENSFSLVYAQQLHQKDSLKYLPFIPAPKYRVGIRADFKNVSKNVPRLYAGLGIDYVFSQNRYFSAYHTETYTPDYCLLGVYAGIDVHFGKTENMLHFRISCDNVLNRVYQNHLNRLKYASINSFTGKQGIFNSGRNISVSLLFDINN